MFELGARPHPPRTLYRAYLGQSDIFVGIYWQSYGWVAPGMEVSGIEDEYRLAAGKPCLVYMKEPAPEREQALAEFFGRVKSDGRLSFKRFGTAAQLGELVADDLALLLTEHFASGGLAEAGAIGPVAPGGVGPAALRPRMLPVPATALVGRERDLKTVCGLIERDDVRLLTLSGLGGIGKTRLALAAAERTADRFADGVGFADLSAVRSPELVPAAAAAALGIPQEGTRPLAEVLPERLASARVLLILDNFEHLVGAAPFVSDLLAGSRALTVVVTSRALLRVRGEHEYPVMPLDTPQMTDPETPVTEDTAAVRLFVERARDSRPGFTLDARNASAVGRLCERLEGIPLAIELAACRIRVLPPQALVDRIGDRLDVPAGPSDLPERQRTLRATIDWSYDLLGEPERRAFAILSVFVAGFTLDGAQALLGPVGLDALDLVSSLVENSLVMPTDLPDAEPRFRMTETVREYAQDRLDEGGEGQDTRLRMARFYAAFAERAAAGLISTEHRNWLARIDPEVGNIRATISWTLSRGEIDLCEAVLVPLWIYWWSRGYVPELRPLTEQILAMNPRLQPAGRAQMLLSAASSRAITGDNEGSRPLLRELIELCRELGDERALAITQAQYAASIEVESTAQARGLLSEAAAVLLRTGDRWGAAYAFGILGQVALLEGDTDEADRVQAEAMRHARAVGSDHLVGLSLNERGLTALLERDYQLAHARFAESARLHERVQDREGLAYCMDGLAHLALARAQPELAASAIGTADAIRDKSGVQVWPVMQSFRAPLISEVSAALGRTAFEAARTAGRQADPAEAARELLGALADGS